MFHDSNISSMSHNYGNKAAGIKGKNLTARLWGLVKQRNKIIKMEELTL